MMTECAHCHDILVKHEELHALSGLLFCSQDCAVEYFADYIVANARNTATKLYFDGAEIIQSKDVLADERYH